MISDQLARYQSAPMDCYSRPRSGFIPAHPMRWGEYYSSNPRTHKGFGYTDGFSKYRNNFHACHPLPIATNLRNFENHMLPRALSQRIQDKVLTEHQYKRRVKRPLTHQVFPTNNCERSDEFGNKALSGATREKLHNYWTQLLDTPKNVQVFLDHRDEIGRRVAALLRRKREQKERDNLAISEYLQNCHLDGIRQPPTWHRKTPEIKANVECHQHGCGVPVDEKQQPEADTYIQKSQRPLTPHQPLPLVPLSTVKPEKSAFLTSTQDGHKYMRQYVTPERQPLTEGVSENLKMPERMDVKRICPIHDDICFRIDCPYRVSLTAIERRDEHDLGENLPVDSYLPRKYEYTFEPNPLCCNVPIKVDAGSNPSEKESFPFYHGSSVILPLYQYPPEPLYAPQSKDQMVSDEDQYHDCYPEPVNRAGNRFLEHSSCCSLKERQFLRPRAKPTLVTSIATWNEGKRVPQSRKKVRFSDEHQMPAIKSDIPPFYKFKEQNFSSAHIGLGDDCPNPVPDLSDVYYTANEHTGNQAGQLQTEYPRYKSWLSPTAHDIPQILYKSDLHKRYHATHFEPVPDLRDFTTYHKQYFFNGFHTSALRG